MKSKKEPKIIEGGFSVDDRGQVSFVNDFDFKGVKRSYLVENFSTETIRAFHGHKEEEKYAFIVSGSAVVAVVLMDDTRKPKRRNEVQKFILSARKPRILFIPAGYANGFRALEPGTKIIFFSTSTVAESIKDDYRFPADYWGKKVWEIENR